MKREYRYADKPGGGRVVTADTLLSSANTRGRVWAVSIFSTADQSAVVIRNGTSVAGTPLIRLDTTATVGSGASMIFPRGLYYDAGLFADVVAGTTPNVSVCWTPDDRADVE